MSEKLTSVKCHILIKYYDLDKNKKIEFFFVEVSTNKEDKQFGDVVKK